MDEKSLDTSVNLSEKTAAGDAERTVAAPRFDDNSVQRARPAVPLDRRARARSWPPALVLICVVAGLAGGLVGGIIAAVIHRNSPPRAQANAQVSAPGDAAKAGEAANAAASVSPAAKSPEAAQVAAAPVEAARAAEASKPSDAEGERPRRDDGQRREQKAAAPSNLPSSSDEAAAGGEEAQASLRGALEEWVAATNARDIGRQMSFYGGRVNAFYLSRNASREDVRAEKARVFERARVVDIRAGEPDIRLSPDGRTATMRFRKRYVIEGGGQDRRGEVLQELRWQRTDQGWRIVGERDLRVLNQP